MRPYTGRLTDVQSSKQKNLTYRIRSAQSLAKWKKRFTTNRKERKRNDKKKKNGMPCFNRKHLTAVSLYGIANKNMNPAKQRLENKQ